MAALGRHTTAVQSQWANQHPGTELVFVHSWSRAAGLTDGVADLAVVRQAPTDPRIASALLGHEARVAALATGDPLARRQRLQMADFTGRTIGLDTIAGTTTADFWPPESAPATRSVHGIDEWLTLIAAGQAIGLTSASSRRIVLATTRRRCRRGPGPARRDTPAAQQGSGQRRLPVPRSSWRSRRPQLAGTARR